MLKQLLDTFISKNNRWFVVFVLTLIATFVLMRPINSPWHPFIAGDGLGYYSYLPAKFIHGDPNYDFKWFNKIYNQNYIYSTFPNPEDNLLVEYHGKKINKYYPGLAFIWMPFFFIGHLFAKVFHYNADGFSLPYQLAIGLASIFYLIVGFLYLRKLLLSLFGTVASFDWIPYLIFFGTNLFNYGLFANSLSHLYSFALMMPLVYYGHKFFNNPDKSLRYFLLCCLFIVLSTSIRPFNLLAIFLLLPLINLNAIKRLKLILKVNLFDLMVIGLILAALIFHFRIVYKQTGSLLAYTYAGETFDFSQSKFWESLISYHNGLFLYSPLLLLSFIGIVYFDKRVQLAWPVFFLLIVYIYSAWWFWPITKRALIDFYIVPALLLGATFKGIGLRKNNMRVLFIAIFMCVGYYQFKAFQLRNGILDENSTYKQVFWDNFFRIEKTSRYPIPPETITRKKEQFEGFELNNVQSGKTALFCKNGKRSLVLDEKNYIQKIGTYPFPLFYSDKDFNKIRVSFWCFFEHGIEKMHAILQFKNQAGEVLVEQALYLNKQDIHVNKWDYKEFGYEFEGLNTLNKNTVSAIELTFWNVESKSKVYIDDVKTEFIVAKESFETIK